MTDRDNTWGHTGEDKKKHGCFAYGCLTLVVLAAIGAIIGGGIYFYGRQTISPYVDNYLQAVNEGKHEEAFTMVGPAWKQIWSLDQYRSFNAQMGSILGKCKDKRLTGCNINKVTGQPTMATVVYEAQFEKGPVTLTFTMSKRGKQWLVEGAHYASPLLLASLMCPHCGKTNKTLGKFCAHCGKAMSKEKVQTM